MHQEDDIDFCKKARKRISKEYRDFNDNVERVEKLIGIQFCPDNPDTPLHKGKHFFPVTGKKGEYAVWRIDIAVKGLRSGAWPRYWFGVVAERELIVPLVMGRHKDYGGRENKIEDVALKTMERFMSTGVVEGTD